MDSEKKWYASKTIIASIISGVIALSVGLRLLPSSAAVEKDALIENIYALVGVITSVVAIYGRITATKTVKKKNKNSKPVNDHWRL